jgi:hypothetical protein
VLAHNGPFDSHAVLDAFKHNTSGYRFLDLMLEESERAATHFEDNSLDWVFIDATHTYDAVISDIQVWAPKIKHAGVLSGHDFGNYGVTDAVLRSFGAVSGCGTIWFTRARPRSPTVIRVRQLCRPLRVGLENTFKHLVR